MAGYKKVIEAIKKLGSRLIGIIGTPGNRSDDSVRAIGYVAGKSFHKIIIKEDKNLRGRKAGEVSRLLLEGVLEAGLSEKSVRLIQDEDEALRTAIREAAAGDIIVVFYEDLESIMDVINHEASKAAVENSSKDITKFKLIKA